MADSENRTVTRAAVEAVDLAREKADLLSWGRLTSWLYILAGAACGVVGLMYFKLAREAERMSTMRKPIEGFECDGCGARSLADGPALPEGWAALKGGGADGREAVKLTHARAAAELPGLVLHACQRCKDVVRYVGVGPGAKFVLLEDDGREDANGGGQ